MAAVKKPVYASSEDAEQEAVVEYCNLLHITIVHIPNEGKRSLSYSYKTPERVILWIVGSAIVVCLFEAGFTAFYMLMEGV